MSNNYKKQFHINKKKPVKYSLYRPSFSALTRVEREQKKELVNQRAPSNQSRALPSRAQFLQRRKQGMAVDRLQLKLMVKKYNP